VTRTTLAARSLASALLIAWGWVALAVAAIAPLGGCAGPFVGPRAEALRISELERVGTARHQASMDLVVEGLDAELGSSPQRARGRYERAIQIDPSNAFAYLALSRYYAALGDSGRALQHLERAESLLDPGAPVYRSVEPHLLGLRGWALAAAGRTAQADPLLADARRLAPSVWGDGRLEASELR
jgi:tetratricopeptide (TPR) repeat protein